MYVEIKKYFLAQFSRLKCGFFKQNVVGCFPQVSTEIFNKILGYGF